MNDGPLRPARMTIAEAVSIMRRDEENAAAKKRGQHRESDMQMKDFSPIRLAYGVLTYFEKARCLSRNVARDALNPVSDVFCL